jgi:hypothetical protein
MDPYQLHRHGNGSKRPTIRAARAAAPPFALVLFWRLGYSSHISSHELRPEVIMADPARRAKLVRDLEQDFVPDYDAQNMPSGDKRAAYALEHIAFRVGRIEQTLARIAAVMESALSKR